MAFLNLAWLIANGFRPCKDLFIDPNFDVYNPLDGGQLAQMMLVHYRVRALRTTMIDPNSNDSDIHGRADSLNVLLTPLREKFDFSICHQMIAFKKTWVLEDEGLR